MRRAASPGTALPALGLVVFTATCAAAPPLEHTHDSPDALARAVLAAVAGRDAPALRNLAVSEREFRDHVWPALPAARPERNLPFSYVWGDLRQKSERHLARALAAHGGRRYALLRVEHAGGTRHYGDYTHITEKYGIRVFIAFVDEREKSIYGNFLDELDKPSGRYPLRYPDVVYFPLSSMRVISELSDEQCAELSALRVSRHDDQARIGGAR